MSTEITQWLNALGTLTAGTLTTDEARAKIAAYVPLLAARFEPAAFTAASLEFVASQCKFFPAYGEVVDHLRSWWHENRPANPYYAALEASPPTARYVSPEESLKRHQASQKTLRRYGLCGLADRLEREFQP